MTTVRCPYCGTTRETQYQIQPGRSFRCPSCRNVFSPPLASTHGPKPEEPKFADQLEIALEELPPPPPLSVVLPPIPEPEPPPLLSSLTIRLVAGGVTAAGAVALLGLVGCWCLSGPRTPLARKPQQIRRPMDEAPPPLPLPPAVAEQQQPPAPELPRAAPPPVVQQPPVAQQQQVPNLLRTDPQQGQAVQDEDADQPPARRLKRQLTDADEKKATSKLYLAKKLDKEGKVRLANKLYQEIIDNFPGSGVAGEAQKLVGYSIDKRVERAAKSLLTAQGLELASQFADAKGVYQEIITLYPDLEQAETAKQRLKSLSGKK